MPQPWKRRVRQMSSAQIIVTFYIVAVTLGFLLLSIPEALKPGVKLAFIDRLFIAVSAVSVTGLTPVSTRIHLVRRAIFARFYLSNRWYWCDDTQYIYLDDFR